MRSRKMQRQKCELVCERRAWGPCARSCRFALHSHLRSCMCLFPIHASAIKRYRLHHAKHPGAVSRAFCRQLQMQLQTCSSCAKHARSNPSTVRVSINLSATVSGKQWCTFRNHAAAAAAVLCMYHGPMHCRDCCHNRKPRITRSTRRKVSETRSLSRDSLAGRICSEFLEIAAAAAGFTTVLSMESSCTCKHAAETQHIKMKC